jgi:serine/threonine protein kinase
MIAERMSQRGGSAKLSLHNPLLLEQKGGSMFAAGDYGCLFKNPTPVCESTGKPINAEVGKIIVESGSGQQEEVKKTQIIKRIPELKNYVIVPTSICRAAAQQPDPEWSNCFLTERESPMLILGMIDGGETLKESLQKTSWFCRNFIPILEHLLEGLVLLHKKGWSHTDIHDKNILIDTNGTPRYIDFGLALNKKNPNKEELDKFSEYNVSLVFMPPEYHVYAMGVNGIDIQTGMLHIISQSIYSRIHNLFPKSESIDSVIYKLIKNGDILTDAVKYYSVFGDKTDIWSLGMVFYRAYMHCLSFPEHLQITQFNKQRIKTILELMLAFNPDARGTAEECLRLVNPYNRFLRVDRLTLSTPLKESERRLPLPLSFTPPPFSRSIRTRRGTQKKSQNNV